MKYGKITDLYERERESSRKKIISGLKHSIKKVKKNLRELEK